MRAALLIVTLAACSPDIAPGAYLCGPEATCPDGLACDGKDTLCVLPSGARPFACGDVGETEPNDGFATAQAIANLACASIQTEVLGCTPDGDREDWYKLAIPSACASVSVVARVSFPIAYERLGLELRAADGASVATDGPCAVHDEQDGDDQRCLTAPVTSGRDYAIRVAPTGEGACGGACAHNRYALTVQLTTP